MDTSRHDLPTLFHQLGLPDTPEEIERFIEEHRLPGSARPLHAYPFWTESQSRFLREAVEEDADWAEVVDELSARLHS